MRSSRRTGLLLASAAGFVFFIAASEGEAAQINLSATVSASCSATSDADLDFGIYDPVVGNSATATFNVQCTAPTSVDLLVDNGLHDNAGARNMENASGSRLGYVLRESENGAAWNGSARTVQVNSANSDVPVSVYGFIVEGQTAATSGTYTDTVQITVNLTPL